jgi:hypothetical protein
VGHETRINTFSALFAAQQLIAHLIDSTLSLDGDLQVTASWRFFGRCCCAENMFSR